MSAAEGALAERIDALLPQTQCTQCGFAGCHPYAVAIAGGAAGINQCPPGGDAGIRALAILTGQAYLPLNPANGVEAPRRVAFIDEAHCIGCTLCIQACPVDAIIGAPKLMHTVIAEWCSGCDLCLAPCPVDCIEMLPPRGAAIAWDAPAQAAARRRYDARNARLGAEHVDRAARRLAARPVDASAAADTAQLRAAPAQLTAADKAGTIAAARERVRRKRLARAQSDTRA